MEKTKRQIIENGANSRTPRLLHSGRRSSGSPGVSSGERAVVVGCVGGWVDVMNGLVGAVGGVYAIPWIFRLCRSLCFVLSSTKNIQRRLLILTYRAPINHPPLESPKKPRAPGVRVREHHHEARARDGQEPLNLPPPMGVLRYRRKGYTNVHG